MDLLYVSRGDQIDLVIDPFAFANGHGQRLVTTFNQQPKK